MTNQEQPSKKISMAIHVIEGVDIGEVARIAAECMNTGGQLVKISFMGIAPSSAISVDPSKIKIEGLYSVIWTTPKPPDESEEGSDGKVAE